MHSLISPLLVFSLPVSHATPFTSCVQAPRRDQTTKCFGGLPLVNINALFTHLFGKKVLILKFFSLNKQRQRFSNLVEFSKPVKVIVERAGLIVAIAGSGWLYCSIKKVLRDHRWQTVEWDIWAKNNASGAQKSESPECSTPDTNPYGTLTPPQHPTKNLQADNPTQTSGLTMRVPTAGAGSAQLIALRSPFAYCPYQRSIRRKISNAYLLEQSLGANVQHAETPLAYSAERAVLHSPSHVGWVYQTPQRALPEEASLTYSE